MAADISHTSTDATIRHTQLRLKGIITQILVFNSSFYYHSYVMKQVKKDLAMLQCDGTSERGGGGGGCKGYKMLGSPKKI